MALSDDTLSCLRMASSPEISSAFLAVMAAAGGAYAFTPTLDGVYLPGLPSTILSTGNFAKIPFIAGTNLDEGALLLK